MTRKRNFDVSGTSDDGKSFSFRGKQCTVKHKSLATRLGLTKDVKERIDCKTIQIEKK